MTTNLLKSDKMNMENSNQFVAYYRVSSKRQREEGVSIEAQRKLILDYAKRNNFEVVKEFDIDESAKKEGRKKFSEMVTYIQANKNILGILCEKVDRLLRGNLKDRVIIEDMVNNEGREIHFIKESLVYNKNAKSFQKLQFDIQNGFARFYLNNLSDEVKKAYDILVDDGFYPHIPPIGYKTKLDDHVAIPDPAVAPFIKRIFELCATGEYSERKIGLMLFDEGFRSRKGNRVGKSAIGKILHTHFYYGFFEWKGEVKPGKHDPIIDKDLFDKVQEVLSPKKKKGYKHDFSFVGLMECGECHNGVTAELQKGHVYYHCTKPRGAQFCHQKYVREEVITEQLAKVIKAVSLDLKKLKTIKDIMSVSLADETEYLQDSLDALNSQYKDLQEQSSKLLDLYLKGKIKEEAYNSKSTEVNKETELVNAEIMKHKTADRAYKQEIEGFLTFCNMAPKLFASSRPVLQRELLRFVVSNLSLKDGLVDFKLKIPFSIVAEYAESENWQVCQDSNLEQRFWRPP